MGPARCRLRSSHGSNLVGRDAWDSNVVLSFENDLDVAQFQARRAPQFRQFARGRDKFINEIISNGEKDLAQLSKPES